MKKVVLLVLVLMISSCAYPSYHDVASPVILSDPKIPNEWHDILVQRVDSCTKNLNEARHDAFKARRRAYQVATGGAIVSMVFGGGAGAFGVAAEKTLSAISGAVALGLGIVQTASVDKNQMESEGKNESDMTTKWTDVNHKVNAFEAVLIEQYNVADTPENQTKRKTALIEMNSSLAACSVSILNPVDFTIRADAAAADKQKQLKLLNGLR